MLQNHKSHQPPRKRTIKNRRKRREIDAKRKKKPESSDIAKRIESKSKKKIPRKDWSKKSPTAGGTVYPNGHHSTIPTNKNSTNKDTDSLRAPASAWNKTTSADF
jgi:hypothetical protein